MKYCWNIDGTETLLRHSWVVFEALLKHYWYIADTLPRHCWHILNTLLTHSWYIADKAIWILLFRTFESKIVSRLNLPRFFEIITKPCHSRRFCQKGETREILVGNSNKTLFYFQKAKTVILIFLYILVHQIW